MKPFIGVICKLVSLENDASFASLDKHSTVSHAEVQKNFLMLPSTSVDMSSHNYMTTYPFYPSPPTPRIIPTVRYRPVHSDAGEKN